MSEATPSKSAADHPPGERVGLAPPADMMSDDKREVAATLPASDARTAPIESTERSRRISERAYWLYAERGYIDGFDVDDWLRAEAIVDQSLIEPRAT